MATRARLSAVDATSGSSSAWNVGSITGTGVNAVVTDGLRVYSGGNFTAFGGTTHNYFGVAALCPTPSTFYRDLDGDTYGDPNASLQLCEQVAGVVTNSNDCDDTDPIKWVSAP
ncbi:MAG: hypothetical protein IPH53_14670 [Flavobacteriales bacterium]|nr:hypothetical protein [Flavobacteriales bacterium]